MAFFFGKKQEAGIFRARLRLQLEVLLSGGETDRQELWPDSSGLHASLKA